MRGEHRLSKLSQMLNGCIRWNHKAHGGRTWKVLEGSMVEDAGTWRQAPRRRQKRFRHEICFPSLETVLETVLLLSGADSQTAAIAYTCQYMPTKCIDVGPSPVSSL